MTLTDAQADIANIPEGSATYYRSPDDTAFAIEVINNSGTLAATGRKMPSQQEVNKAANSAQLAGVTVEDQLYDEEGVEIVHALADADGKAPLTTNRLGAVGLARAEVAALGGNAVPWAITDSRRIPYISGTPMGGVQIGNVEIVEIPGPPGIVFCDANYIPMACTPGFDTDQNIPVIGGSGGTPETPVIPIYLRDWNGVRSQGQSLSIDEMPLASYSSMLTQYISDMTTDTVSITGQDYTPFFISYQMASHRQYRVTNPLIALALRDVALTGLSRLSHPAYIGDYVDNVHGTNETYLMFAKYYGRAVHKLLQDNQAGEKTGMHWLDKIGETRQGNIINLQFNIPHPPLVIDTIWVTEAENYGFHIRDMTTQNFDVVDIISAVEIAGSDRVRIICSRAPTDNEQVTYGWGKAGDPMTTGRTTGPRGNLRDSEGELPGESYTDTSGTLRKLHNWCVIF